MRAVDTNVLVRLLALDDPKQAQVAAAFVTGGAWVSHLVLAEATWVLSAVFARTPRQIAEALSQIVEHESLVVQEADVVSQALAHYRSKPTLGFSDCLILEIARKAGHVPLGTFDRDLSRLDGAEKLKA